jgi:hypothetical protein
LWKGVVNCSAYIVATGAGAGFQTVELISPPENSQECKNQGFLKIDGEWIRQNQFSKRIFPYSLNKKIVKGTTAGDQHGRIIRLSRDTSDLDCDMFRKGPKLIPGRYIKLLKNRVDL